MRFAEGCKAFAEPRQILLEVGPGRTLATSVLRHREQAGGNGCFHVAASSRDLQSDVEFLLTTLGKLWLAGAPGGLVGILHRMNAGIASPLPTYPFERQRYWIEPPKPTGNGETIPGTSPGPTPPRKKTRIADWFYIPSWKRSVSAPPAARNIRSSLLAGIHRRLRPRCQVG